MNCAICLGEPHNPQTVPCCLKIFCSECLSNWINIRNSCPLCIKLIGQEQKNELKSNQSQDFDNGSLMLQQQLAAIVQRVSFLFALIKQKRTNVKNYKNSFPKSHLQFIQAQMCDIQQTMQFASLSLSTNDRDGATTSIQIMTQKIYKIEGVLNGEYTIQEDYSSDQQIEDDYNEYEEYEQYEERQQMNRNKPKKKNDKTERVNI